MIKLIESEIELLIKIRKELLSTRNKTRNIGGAGELSSVIMDGYGKLTKLKQKVLINDDLMLQARFRIKELDAGIEKLRSGREVTPVEIVALNDRIGQARLEIEVLESQAKELDDEFAVPDSTDRPGGVFEDSMAKARDSMALLEEEIVSLVANRKNVKNMVLIQRPTSGVSPLTPDTKRNVIIGAVVGLFLSLFLAVFLEYVYKKPEE